MEEQKSVVVVRQRNEKAHEGISDGFVKVEDIVKSSIYRNVKKLETGETIVAKDSKGRGEKGIENGGEPEKNAHSITCPLFTSEMLQSEFDYYMAQKLLKKLREVDLISEGEFNKITAKNRQTFSPYLAELMPEMT